MLGKGNPKSKYKNIQEVYEKVKRRLSFLKGEKNYNVPSQELREKIALELRENKEKEEESLSIKKIKTADKTSKPQKKTETIKSLAEKKIRLPEKKSSMYGEYTPPPLYVRLKQRRKDEPIKEGRLSKYRVMPLGSTTLDYITHLPTVSKRLLLDLREPIPVLDKLLFAIVYLIAYFITVIFMVAHYKFIKPDINYVVQIDNQFVELVVKQEDIPSLKKALGDDWLHKLGKIQLKNQESK